MYHYVSIADRLKMFLQDKRMNTVLKLDPNPPRGAAGEVRNLYESDGWNDHVLRGCGRDTRAPAEDPNFATENNGRNIVLSMCADGFQPWTEVQNYSITPFMLMVLNFPENLRHKFQYMHMAGVVPGPRKPKDLQPYLRIVVDELLELYRDGVEYRDPFDGVMRTSRVKLLFTSADYPGHSDLNNQQCQNATYGCMKCVIKGTTLFERMAYNGYKEKARGVLPQRRTHKSIVEGGRIADEFYAKEKSDAALKKRRAEVEGKPYKPLQKQRALPVACQGVTGMSELARLPYFDMAEHTLLDMMHTISGVVKGHIVPLSKGARLKGIISSGQLGQSAAARDREEQDRFDRIARDEYHDPEEDAAPFAPAAVAARAATEKKHIADMDKKWRCPVDHWQLLETKCLGEIQAPGGIVTKRPYSLTGQTTAHDWLSFVRVYGKYFISQYYVGNEQVLMCDIFDIIKLASLQCITTEVLKELDVLVKRVCKNFDLLPDTEMAIVFHNLIFHMPAAVRKWGSVRATWCFPFERYVRVQL
jgi:hypothetical protein